MDLHREDPGRLTRLAAWLQATPAELAGLTVLLAGAILATGLLWWQAHQRPAPGDPAPAATGHPDADSGYLDPELDPHWPAEDHPGAHGSDAASTTRPDGPLTVHVTGAVAQPGLVTVPSGARVGDAVAAAGGLRADAEVAAVNLARLLQDGEHVHVPAEGEPPPPGGSAASGDPTGAAGGLVDLNRASVEELQTLPGIGPALAQRIVDHRQTHGPFRTPGDLRAVSGIGEKTFQRLAELVTVS